MPNNTHLPPLKLSATPLTATKANIPQKTAIFNFQSLLMVILLTICTSTYIHAMFPSFMDSKKDGILGIFWKAARIGERLSPYVSVCCILMAVSALST
jgi:hypothetical protein